MYEYNSENRPQDPWSDPIETTGRPLHDGPEQPKQKKKKGGKLVALCLVCAIIGGIAGEAAWRRPLARSPRSRPQSMKGLVPLQWSMCPM